MFKQCSKCAYEKDLSCFHKRKDSKDGHRAECKECLIKHQKNYYDTHKEQRIESIKKWQKNNYEYRLLIDKEWRAKNRDQVAQREKAYRKKHEIHYKMMGAKRRAALRNRYPSWLTKEDIQNIAKIYTLAKILTEQTGVIHHVDHVVPLLGKTVSGLHVPWNLRVITATENLKKHNKLIEELISL